MKKHLLPLAAVLLTAAFGLSQTWDGTYTRPAIPSRDALSRLNLKEGWHTYVAMDGRRDGIYSVDVLGDQILVQNRSGTVTLLDANDGSTLWRAQPGNPYLVDQAPAHNSRSIFVVRGGDFYALDRKTGKLSWHMTLPHGVTATPFADEQHFYLCLLTKELYAYDLPETVAAHLAAAPQLGGAEADAADLERAELAARMGTTQGNAGGKLTTLPPPVHLWTYSAETRLERAPLATKNLLAVSGVEGIYFACQKLNGRLRYRFRAEAAVTAPLGQYDTTAYMASQDTNVYAVDIDQGRIKWRFVAGAPILRKLEVQDDGLYVAPFRGGLFRIDRETGQQIWHNRLAGRFVAANKKFVYSMDRTGRLVVLDRARGNTLATLDTRGYVFPVANERTDRIFLAANDGLVLCLYDRDYPQPVRMKNSPEILRDYAGYHEAPAAKSQKAPATKKPAASKKKSKLDEGDDNEP